MPPIGICCSTSASEARRSSSASSSRKVFAKLLQKAGFADRLHVGHADAVGRQHAGERMDQNALHAERIGDCAGVLASGPAVTGERVAGYVMAARNRDLADRGSHVVDGDVEESLGNLFEALRSANLACDLFAGRSRDASMSSGSSPSRSEDRRKVRRVDPTEEQVAIGNRQRTAVPVAGGPGFAPQRFPGQREIACRRIGRPSRRPLRPC